MNNEDYNIFLFYDNPIPYKTLKIYPVTMEYYIDFHWYVTCLLLEKNSIADVKVISMSYLRYIFYEAERGNEIFLQMLNMLFFLVLKIDPEKEDIKFYLKDDKAYFSIRGVEFNSDDFDKMKDIIFMQNGIEPIDETIQKELRDEMAKAEEYKIRQNTHKIGTLEDQMICVLISTSLKLEDIYKLTIRKFTKVLQRIDHKMHYQIYKSAEMSGFVTFKNKDAIVGWMADLETKDKYADVKVDMEEVKEKING